MSDTSVYFVTGNQGGVGKTLVGKALKCYLNENIQKTAIFLLEMDLIVKIRLKHLT